MINLQCNPPVVIDNDEVILYAIFDPDHVKDGEVSTAAFQTTQLDQGSLSICRCFYSSQNEIINKIVTPRSERRPEIIFCGVLTALCETIRDIKESEVFAFSVKSDPLDGFPSHGLIGFTDTFKRTANKSKKVQARAELKRVFGNIKQIENILS